MLFSLICLFSLRPPLCCLVATALVSLFPLWIRSKICRLPALLRKLEIFFPLLFVSATCFTQACHLLEVTSPLPGIALRSQPLLQGNRSYKEVMACKFLPRRQAVSSVRKCKSPLPTWCSLAHASVKSSWSVCTRLVSLQQCWGASFRALWCLSAFQCLSACSPRPCCPHHLVFPG